MNTQKLVTKFEQFAVEHARTQNSHTDFSLELIKSKVMLGYKHYWFYNDTLENLEKKFEESKSYNFLWNVLYNCNDFVGFKFASLGSDDEKLKTMFTLEDKFFIASNTSPSIDFLNDFPDLVVF